MPNNIHDLYFFLTELYLSRDVDGRLKYKKTWDETIYGFLIGTFSSIKDKGTTHRRRTSLFSEIGVNWS